MTRETQFVGCVVSVRFPFRTRSASLTIHVQEITSSFDGSYPSGLGIIETARHLSTGVFAPVGEAEEGVPTPTTWKSDAMWQA